MLGPIRQARSRKNSRSSSKSKSAKSIQAESSPKILVNSNCDASISKNQSPNSVNYQDQGMLESSESESSQSFEMMEYGLEYDVENGESESEEAKTPTNFTLNPKENNSLAIAAK